MEFADNIYGFLSILTAKVGYSMRAYFMKLNRNVSF